MLKGMVRIEGGADATDVPEVRPDGFVRTRFADRSVERSGGMT